MTRKLLLLAAILCVISVSLFSYSDINKPIQAKQEDRVYNFRPPIVLDAEINFATGDYNYYSLGIIRDTLYFGGSGCYDDKGRFLILINSKYAVNPTYNQLIDFLKRDKSDLYPYYNDGTTRPYRGSPESNVDLQNIKDIIDGIKQPENPNVCGDYAERLHNDAELEGIRCAFVSVCFKEMEFRHALNAFQTSDKGVVFIDNTGLPLGENKTRRLMKTVDLNAGKDYKPKSLFEESGWKSCGIVEGVRITWDGEWNEDRK